MASVEDLIAKIDDHALRKELELSLRKLQDNREFGLVFQDHAPESVELPSYVIRRGLRVRYRGSKNKQTFITTSAVRAGLVSIVESDSFGKANMDAAARREKATELVVVKNFGEPIYPGLKSLGTLGQPSLSQPSHVVLNAENFHALQALRYTHLGKVDLIYIDPPYNTGAEDWKYNDRYIESADLYRHSKWLSFMDKRLRLANDLLTDSGVVVMAIDDNEHHRLRMLADNIFGERNFLANITWQGSGSSLSKTTSGGVDYMVIYAKDRASHLSGHRWHEDKVGVDEIVSQAKQFFESSLKLQNDAHESPVLAAEAATKQMKAWWRTNAGRFEPGMKLYDRVDPSGRLYQTGDLSASNNAFYEVLHPNGKPVKLPSTGWRASQETMRKWISEGRVQFGADESTTPRLKRFLEDMTSQLPAPTVVRNRLGSKHLQKVFGDRRFPFPKDHDELMRWFRMIAPKDAVILDFFAGSGSTAEAVLRLNDEDGGTRQCILVTNNELSKAEDLEQRGKGLLPGDEAYEARGVFHHVTKPRIETVITGVREDGKKFSDGISGQSVEFFELTYQEPDSVDVGEPFNQVSGLIWLAAGARGQRVVDDGTGWQAPKGANYAILFDPDSQNGLLEEIAFRSDIQQVHIVTDSKHVFQKIAANLPKRLRDENVHHLYSSYLRNFEINTKAGRAA